MLRQSTATGMRSSETESCKWIKPKVCKPRNRETIAANIPLAMVSASVKSISCNFNRDWGYRISSQSAENSSRDTPIYKCSDRISWHEKPRNRILLVGQIQSLQARNRQAIAAIYPWQWYLSILCNFMWGFGSQSKEGCRTVHPSLMLKQGTATGISLRSPEIEPMGQIQIQSL